MSKFKAYIDETTDELVNKVTWPTWKELQGSAVMVMVASAIIALIILAMDTAFNRGLSFIYGLF
jgi:preprotein translocase subunit SecE